MAMPCYDSVKVNSMLSVIKLVQQLAKSGIECGINTYKSPLVHQARNYLTSVFLTTEYTHMLFIDSDVEFEPEAVLRMLVAKKDIICTPYRIKAEALTEQVYTVSFKDRKSILIIPGGLVEIEAGPTGLKLIARKEDEKIMIQARVMSSITTSLVLILKMATLSGRISPSADWPEPMASSSSLIFNRRQSTMAPMPGRVRSGTL